MKKPHRGDRLYNRDREVRTVGVRVAERIVVPEICVQQNARGGKGPMTKTPITLQELRQRIYRKAKSEPTHRFWGLFTHITKMTTLHEAFQQARKNNGAPGIDGKSFADIDLEGVIPFLTGIQEELQAGIYRPQANRKVEIPEANGKTRTLQIPYIRDRVVQGALKLILEAIFEADFCPNPYGFRPKLGLVRFAKSHEVEGRIVNATVRRNPSGRYFVSLLVETEVQELPKTSSYIGIGVGLKDFAILSDGTHYENPKFFQSLEDKLAKAHRVLSRRMKGSYA